MSTYYTDKIKVICTDLQCFPVHAKTLEPLACGCYDPWAITDPEHDPIETISHSEWCRRRWELMK